MSGGATTGVLPQAAKAGIRAVMLGATANAVLAALKIAAGVAGHSSAMVADGIESLTDMGGSMIVWLGVTISHQPADKDHPYGHGRADTLAAGFTSLLLLGVALLILVKSAQGLTGLRPPPAWFTLPVLMFAALTKEWLCRRIARTGTKIESHALKTDAYHHRSDAFVSGAAAVGIVIALVGGKGYESADSWAAIIAAFVIAWNGLNLLRPVVQELMEAAPPPEFLGQVEAVAARVAGVKKVEKCAARRVGREFVIEMHIEVDPEMNVKKAHALAHAVKDDVRAAMKNIQDVVIHVEPNRAEN
jgi:cation diffusion facilitator family transporter